jgi:hypothetical protein
MKDEREAAYIKFKKQAGFDEKCSPDGAQRNPGGAAMRRGSPRMTRRRRRRFIQATLPTLHGVVSQKN